MVSFTCSYFDALTCWLTLMQQKKANSCPGNSWKMIVKNTSGRRVLELTVSYMLGSEDSSGDHAALLTLHAQYLIFMGPSVPSAQVGLSTAAPVCASLTLLSTVKGAYSLLLSHWCSSTFCPILKSQKGRTRLIFWQSSCGDQVTGWLSCVMWYARHCCL
jgi:hypothetical protein